MIGSVSFTVELLYLNSCLTIFRSNFLVLIKIETAIFGEYFVSTFHFIHTNIDLPLRL